MEYAMSNLKKESLPKSYENINRFLEGKPEETYYNLIECAGNVEALDTYEKSIRLIIIDSLKSKEGVVQALLSNDLQQIRRALHCDWFFKDALSPDFYKTEIFPKVSISSRCKIIHQLSKHLENKDYAEEIFEFVKSNYGINQAVILLPKCRPELVLLHLTNKELDLDLKIWRRVLLKLAPIYPHVVLEIFENWCCEDSPSHYNLSKCSKVFLYLAINHQDLFIPFFEEHYSSLSFLHFGDKLRRKLSPRLLDIVLKSDKELERGTFNNKTIFRELDYENKINFLAKVISTKGGWYVDTKEKDFSPWKRNLQNILQYVKSRPDYERADLFNRVFHKVFKEELWKRPEVWTLPMMELLPVEIREKCVATLAKSFPNHKYKKTSVERNVSDQLAYLLDCKKSIPKLKKMIKKMPSADDREIVLLEMVKSCSINKDFQSLYKVCEYIKSRHRNEDCSIIESILKSINESFDFRKFDLNLWTTLEGLLTMCILLDSSTHDVYELMIEKYVFFLLKNNLDPTEQIKNLAKYLILHHSYRNLIRNIKLPFADVFFHKYYNELIRAINEDNLRKDQIKFVIGKILDTLNKYNECHVESKISSEELKELIPCIDKLFELYSNDREWLSGIVLSMLEDPFLRKKYSRFCDKERNLNIMYLLKKDPKVLESHENLFKLLFEHNEQRFINNIYVSKKFFDFYNASEKFKIITAEKFQQLNLDYHHLREKTYALVLLSYFVNISEYEALIQDYLPNGREIDYKNNSKEFVHMQTRVPKLIKNIQPQWKNFPLIFKFLVGDFLKYVLGTLSAACDYSPVEMVSSILKEKIDSPVSVKKAILRNISAVSTIEERIKFCNDLWEKEKHDSIRTIIFKRISDNFLNEPTDELFNLLKKCILESTEVTIEARPEVERIPRQYKNEYVTALWEFAETLTGNDNLKNNIKKSLIKEFDEKNINLLSDELCEKIIRRELFLYELGDCYIVNSFAFSYLLSNPESVNKKLELLINIVRERKANQNLAYYPKLKQFAKFFKGLVHFSCKNCKDRYSIFYEIFDKIVTIWPSIFAKNELFEEFLLMKYHQIFYEILTHEDSSNVLNVTMKFVDELKKIIKSTPNYQDLIAHFSSTVKTVSNDMNSKGLLDEILMIRLLISSRERHFVLIGISLLGCENFKKIEVDEMSDDTITLDKETNVKYIHKILKNLEDDVVKIIYTKRCVGESKCGES